LAAPVFTKLLPMQTFFRACFVALLWYPLTVSAQIQDLGSDATLDIATWNIEWFGHPSNGPTNDTVQLENVSDIIEGSGVDIWAVQEIARSNRFDDLLASLPDHWSGLLATDSGEQRIGYIWDTRVLQLRQSTHILQSFDYAFAGRPPLKAEFSVTLPDTSFVATFITVHMKAFSDRTSYERRVEAAKRIKNHIDFTGLASQPVFFLGDYNDELVSSTYNGQPSPYQPFVDDPADYEVLTLPLEEAGGFSFQSGSFLDHIIVSNEADALWLQGSTRVLTNLVTVNSFYARTSDHLPVMASFGPSTVTSVDGPHSVPGALSLSAPWPNPSTGAVDLDVTGSDRNAMVQVMDVLGRVVFEQQAAPGRVHLDLSDLADGLYVVRLTSERGIAHRTVVLTR